MQAGPSGYPASGSMGGGSLLDELLLAQGRQAMLGNGQALLEDVEMTWDGDETRDYESSCLLALDTNVLIDHLAGIEALHDLLSGSDQSDISLLIPTVVINELDRLKTSPSVQGGARRATNFLLDCNKATRERGRGALRCQRWVERQDKTLNKADDRILDCCLYFAEQGKRVVLWTGDHNLAVLAETNDVPTIGGKDTSLADILRPTGIEIPPAVMNRLRALPSGRATARQLSPTKPAVKQVDSSVSAHASGPASSPQSSLMGRIGPQVSPTSPKKKKNPAPALQPPSPKKQHLQAVEPPNTSPKKKSKARKESVQLPEHGGSLLLAPAAAITPAHDPDAMDLDMDLDDYPMYAPSISAHPPIQPAQVSSPQTSPKKKKSAPPSPHTSPKKKASAPPSPQTSPKKKSKSQRRRSSLASDAGYPIPPEPPVRLPSRVPAAPPKPGKKQRSGTPAQPLPPELLNDLLQVFTPIYRHVATSLNLSSSPEIDTRQVRRTRRGGRRSSGGGNQDGSSSLLTRLLASLLAALRQGYTAAPDRTTTRLLSRLIGAMADILNYIDPPADSASTSATATRIGTVVDALEAIAVVLPQLNWAHDPPLLSHVLLQAKDLI